MAARANGAPSCCVAGLGSLGLTPSWRRCAGKRVMQGAGLADERRRRHDGRHLSRRAGAPPPSVAQPTSLQTTRRPIPQGFRKVDPDRWEFANSLFVRGHPELLADIHRRKPGVLEPRARAGAGPDGSALSAVELGVYGGLAAEVETLQRDKRLLMAEVVRLRQAQTASDSALAGLQARVEAGEARQQQLAAFLSSAMQHPALLQHLAGAPAQPMPRIGDGRRASRDRILLGVSRGEGG